MESKELHPLRLPISYINHSNCNKMKNIKDYIQLTQSNFTCQQESFFEQQLLTLTDSQRVSFNGYLFYSNFHPTVKASHETIANGKISKSSQIRNTKKFSDIGLLVRIKTHHRRPLTTIIHPIIYNLQFRKRMSKFFPLFKYLPEILLFSLSISNSIFNTSLIKVSNDTSFIKQEFYKKEVSGTCSYKKTCYFRERYSNKNIIRKEAFPNRKTGEQKMLQGAISDLLSKIAQDLKFTKEQTKRVSEYNDVLLMHAFKHSQNKKEPFPYFLKVCLLEVGNPKFKQQSNLKKQNFSNNQTPRGYQENSKLGQPISSDNVYLGKDSSLVEERKKWEPQKRDVLTALQMAIKLKEFLSAPSDPHFIKIHGQQVADKMKERMIANFLYDEYLITGEPAEEAALQFISLYRNKLSQTL